MREHFIVAWRSGLRSRSFHALFILGFLAMGGAYLAAQFSGRQPGTVALDVGISSIRLIAVLMVVFWCQELIAREIERKTVFFALTYPVPRAWYLLGRFFGIVGLGTVAIVILGVLLIGTTKIAGAGYLENSQANLGTGYWATLCFILIDVATIAAFTILVATISTTPLLPMALGAAFAIAARSLGTALSYLHDSQSGAADLVDTLGPVVDAFRWIIPDLGRLDIRAVALYGRWPQPEAMTWPALMAFFYSAATLAIAITIFRKRQFV